ncbi:OLC1v1006024C1 [Oldenlandia corymbosa var. corymbosa]|uniref:OLC1v1006024C1 n=1 Tax=Oldenlandia corymbosa var. corymbosa TaxID=529605 RepID=A0AAV1DID6_OLDCO|nr:OLC1v1006024C1 [Oldenlandia corymbosa var. corymbosa]
MSCGSDKKSSALGDFGFDSLQEYGKSDFREVLEQMLCNSLPRTTFINMDSLRQQDYARYKKIKNWIRHQNVTLVTLANQIILAEAKDYSNFASLLVTDGSPLGGPRLSFANGIWLDQSLSFKQDFRSSAENVYKAHCSQVDFQNKPDEVANELNKWAENGTNGPIKDIIPPGSIDSCTRVIFANALYFKGIWNHKFDPSMTKEYDFHLLDGSTVKAPFMTSWYKLQYVNADEDFKVLRLPYEQGDDENRRFSMYLYLPNAKDGLPALIDQISSQAGSFEHHSAWSSAEFVVKFLVPKFKIMYELEICETLKHMGLALPYTIEDLAAIVDSPVGDHHRAVSRILQKSFVEVNEKGTEGAVASCTSPSYCTSEEDISVVVFKHLHIIGMSLFVYFRCV